MKRLTYKEAYDKIIEAYFKNEIQPLSASFCFCGTLANNECEWFDIRNSEKIIHGYSGLEYFKIESALLKTMQKEFGGPICASFDSPLYEDALFNGMCVALEVLKEIHRSSGENVDEEVVPFTKRNLKPVNV